MKLIRSLYIAAGLVCVTSASLGLSADEGWEELQNWVQSLEEEDNKPPSGAAEIQTGAREVPDLTKASPQEAFSKDPADSPETPSDEPQIIDPAIISSPPRQERKAVVAKPVKAPSRPQSASPGPEQSSPEPSAAPSPVTLTPSGSVASPVTPPRARKRGKKEEEKKPENLFAEHFIMDPDKKIQHQTSEAVGFVFVESAGPGGKPVYSIVTDFKGNAVRTQRIPDVESIDEARKWVEERLEVSEFEGAEVRKLNLPAAGDQTRPIYYVGHKSFDTPEKAFAEIAMVKAASETKGLDFGKMVQDAQVYVRAPEEPQPIEIEAPANFEKEEKMFLKMFDGLDVGEKLFGPFTGEAAGQKIVWQSFGETTWRRTNLESLDFKEQVGFWTNRVVFRGIRAPFDTINPFLESTIAMESDGIDFKDVLILYAGAEWYFLDDNSWLYNYRPYGLPLLDWIRSFRFYVQYGDRYNLKDEITGSKGYDIRWGFQIYKEWGIELPGANEGAPGTVPDLLRNYVWGEYYGNYYAQRTGFGAEENPNDVILNSTVTLGVHLPGIPLPPNPINNELALMPYMRFEHVNSEEFSFPFQNRAFLAAGIAWMPFRTYAYKNNEWASKFRIFGEYVGVGGVHHFKQDGEAPDTVDWDLRFGFRLTSNRY